MINKMELTSDNLAEMQELAVRLGVESSLDYRELQQVLTIKSLELFLNQYGIDLPVSVDKLGGYKSGKEKE